MHPFWCRASALRRAEFQPFDPAGVELAAVRRVDDHRFADEVGVQAPAVAAAHVAAARADVAHRVHFQAGAVVQLLVLLPGRRREAVTLAKPEEFGLQRVVVDGQALQFAAVDVVLALVLDFHLAADEGCQDLRVQQSVQNVAPCVRTPLRDLTGSSIRYVHYD